MRLSWLRSHQQQPARIGRRREVVHCIAALLLVDAQEAAQCSRDVHYLSRLIENNGIDLADRVAGRVGGLFADELSASSIKDLLMPVAARKALR
jgi:hypothetical protein